MKDFLKNLKLNEANVSMLLGIVVVLIVGSLLVNYFRSVNKAPDTSSTQTETTTVTEPPKLENLPAEYEVQKGDSLWSLSEKVYGTGYNWGDIYDSNKEALGNNPNTLVEGTELTFPKVEPKQLSSTSAEEITPAHDTHIVEKGDNLWKIAVVECADGYSWTNIAQANSLSNPNVIEVGQELTIACR